MLNSALQPPHYNYGHFFWLPGKSRRTFYCKKSLLNTANFFWPIMVAVLMGFHCTSKSGGF